MQSTIERATILVNPRRSVRLEVPEEESSSAYKAPLATFLALVASARASACSGDTAAPLEANRSAGVDG